MLPDSYAPAWLPALLILLPFVIALLVLVKG
jgi:hypothetical protein